MNRRAIIFGLKGSKLRTKDKRFLKIAKPWGIILFSRNIRNLKQLKTLILDIKKVFKDKNYPILVDQEGGKVSRLNKIIDLSLFSQEFFGKIYLNDNKNFLKRYKIYINMVSEILSNLGININIAPVLDVRRRDAHNIIGNRSYSTNPKIVSNIGKICVDYFKANKIATVIKHIPGHGMAKCDSHFKTPIIKLKKKILIKNDFKAFKKSNSMFAMTAHAIYTAYDSVSTATHSRKIIEKVIRRHIGFKGILISDDISMKALRFGLKNNAKKALNAGCNLVMHCNGNINEMKKLIKVIPKIDEFTQKKTEHFYNFLR
tara:strand:+ start:768 stop:1715 length:948 start_codon:yes stop_codon:yes gene_type:complete